MTGSQSVSALTDDYRYYSRPQLLFFEFLYFLVSIEQKEIIFITLLLLDYKSLILCVSIGYRAGLRVFQSVGYYIILQSMSIHSPLI